MSKYFYYIQVYALGKDLNTSSGNKLKGKILFDLHICCWGRYLVLFERKKNHHAFQRLDF